MPTGPLNVVTVDLIFHKCKPIGGRRFHFPHYLKALAAIAQDSGHNVFELIGLLGMQIKPHALVFEKPLVSEVWVDTSARGARASRPRAAPHSLPWSG